MTKQKVWAVISLGVILILGYVVCDAMDISFISGLLSVVSWVSLNLLIEEADDAAWYDEALPATYKLKVFAWIGLALLTIFSWH